MNEISINPPIFTECLWFNNFICIDNKSIFFSEWYKNGIMFLKDIINNDGSFLTLDEFYEKFKFQHPLFFNTTVSFPLSQITGKNMSKTKHILPIAKGI